MTLQLAMDMAGTFPILGYIFIKKIFKKQVSAQQYIRMLRLAVVLYLCPFQQFKYLILSTSVLERWNLNEFWRITEKKIGGFKVVNIPSLSGSYYNLPEMLFRMCIIWFSICAGLILYHYGRYFLIKRKIRKSGRKTELLYRKNGRTVEVFQSNRIKTPCTVGWIHPEIFIPEKTYTAAEKEWLLAHELTHIRHGDVFWKCVLMFCIVCHWYNPFVYYLFRQYAVMCEYYCDAECMKNCDIEEKKNYAVFLVRSAVIAKPQHRLAIMQGLTNNGERMQERVDRIITEDKYPIWRSHLIVTGIFAVVCMCSLMTVFVYSATPKQDVPAEDNTFTEEEWDYFYGHDASFDDEKLDFSQSPFIFQSEKGENIVVSESELMNSSSNKQTTESQKACKHVMEKGLLKLHTQEKGSTASCHIKTYNARRCEKCGLVKYLDLSYTSDYKECPHNVDQNAK